MKTQRSTPAQVRERRELIRTLSLDGQTVAQIIPQILAFMPTNKKETPERIHLRTRKIVEKDRRLMGLSTYVMVDRETVRARRIEMRSLLNKAAPFSVQEFAAKHNVTPQAITNDLARMGESKNPAWMAKRLNAAFGRVLAGLSTREAARQNRVSLPSLRRFLVSTCPEWRELRRCTEDGPVTWVWPKKTDAFLDRLDHVPEGTRDALNRSALDAAVQRQAVPALIGLLERTPEIAEDLRRRVHEQRRPKVEVLDLLARYGVPIDEAWIDRYRKQQARADRKLLIGSDEPTHLTIHRLI
jgi:lambda repressor-like predicted transcriptional regulator